MSPFHHGVGRVLRHSRILGAVFAAAIVAGGLSASVLESTPATAATVGFSQCNNKGAGPGGAPLSVACSITVTNTIDATGGTSASVYSRICTLDGCTGDTTSASNVINAVHQCNGSDNVGGSTTTCSVHIINNISASAPGAPHAITVNQCIGSGGGDPAGLMTACIPSSSGGATVTQCNGSGNGGGATLTCTASGTVSDAFPVTVDQCNGSENGGGSVVVCNVTMETNVIDTSLGESGGPGGGTPGGGTPTGDTGLGLTGTPLQPGPPVAVETPSAGLTG